MNKDILSVTETTKVIKRLIESSPLLSYIKIRGEISNFKRHSSGHIYLTLKDNKSRINCVMFRSSAVNLKFFPENGDEVIATGRISVFEPYGNYQLYINSMKRAGIGDLHQRFEELKEELLEKGYFDSAHKKKIPLIPRRVGVITSRTGAAFRDIVNISRRRFRNIPILLYNCLVQGENSAKDIVNGIRELNKIPDIDVIILGRGGGSFEDLFSFNEKIVAEAIFKSKIPIVSAVGHETDFTISDMVADLRAPTPSAAAELIFPDKEKLVNNLLKLKKSMDFIMSKKEEYFINLLEKSEKWFATDYFLERINLKVDELERYKKSLVSILPSKIELNYRKLEAVNPAKLEKYLISKVENLSYKLENMKEKCYKSVNSRIETGENKINSLEKSLQLLNHKSTMKRGFSIVRKNDSSKPVKNSKNIKNGDTIIIEFYEGEKIIKINEKEKIGNDE